MKKKVLKIILLTEGYITIAELKGITDKYDIKTLSNQRKSDIVDLLLTKLTVEETIEELKLNGKAIDEEYLDTSEETATTQDQDPSQDQNQDQNQDQKEWSIDNKLKLSHVILIGLTLLTTWSIYYLTRPNTEGTKLDKSNILMGKLYNIEGGSIYNAKIEIDKLPVIYSDSSGTFTLEVPLESIMNNYTVEVSKTGFKTIRRVIDSESMFKAVLEKK